MKKEKRSPDHDTELMLMELRKLQARKDSVKKDLDWYKSRVVEFEDNLKTVDDKISALKVNLSVKPHVPNKQERKAMRQELAKNQKNR